MSEDVQSGAEISLVVLKDEPVDLGLDASHIIGICAERDWSGEPPMELSPSNRLADDSSEIRIVVVRRRNRDPLPLRARSALSVVRIALSAVLPMPVLIRLHVRWFSAVAITGETSRAILVIDPDEFEPMVVGR